jgi:DNA polymerase III delta prime subunit
MQITQSHCFSVELAGRQPVACRLLANAIGADRMAHAILLTGRALSDKWLIARQLAAFLNCQSDVKFEHGSCLLPYIHSNDPAIDQVNEQGQAAPASPADVGKSSNVPDNKTFSLACQNCRWLFKDEHPKAWTVLSREAGKSGKIPVESARNLSEELARTSQYLRLVVIDDASDSAFHRPAANALLKTIEEPRSNCLFILFGQCQEDVLQTIVSRCQLIPLNNLYEDNLGHLAGPSSTLRAGLRTRLSEEDKELRQSLGSEIFLTTQPGKKVSVKDALIFAHHLGEVIDDDNFEKAFDLIINMEIEKLAGIYRTNALYSRYLESLFKLAEEAKRQWDHYVTKKGVCESFVLSWLDLRQNLIR